MIKQLLKIMLALAVVCGAHGAPHCWLSGAEAHAATIQLPATGQTGCWDTNGTAITCSGTGQDGDKLKGAAWPGQRLSDNGDQTVTDNLTGLVWTKNGNPAAAAKTWQGALDYIATLNSQNHLGYSDWRLPNRKELMSLVNRQQANSATWLNAQGFSNVQANFYWSSSSYAYSTYGAWGVRMSSGGVNVNGRTYDLYVWPVRGGQSGALGSLTISASPSSISFGTTDISTPSAAQTVTIANSGTAQATLGTTALGGTNSGDFSITSDTCSGQTLLAGTTCAVSLRFSPSLIGAKSATLTINDATQKSAASVALSGTAVVSQPTLVIQKSGAGNGAVTSAPAGIDCGATCSAAFSDKTQVNLTAAAADGSVFLGWSGGGCSGANGCTVALDYAVSSSTMVTANFGNTSACQQQIDDVVIKATSCTQMSNYAEYSGTISISHATNPGNPVLKIDNGTLNVDLVNKNISAPLGSSSSLYVPNVKNIGNAPLGFNYSFDINGSELTTNGQGILAKLLKTLLIDVEIKKITLGGDEALIEGQLGLSDSVKRLRKTTGVPIDINISSIMLSQSKGFYPGSVSLTIQELAIEGTPVSLSDVKINMDGIKEEIEIEGTVTIKRLVSPTPGMAGREFTGRLTLAKGGLQGFAISAGNLNIPLGASPFYLQQIGGSVDGFKKDPVIISLKTSFSGGPKLNLGDLVGNYQTLCFNDVSVEIDPNSYFKHSGGAGILCFDSWEQAKNGAIAARLDGEFNWKTSSFKEKGTLTFPYEVLKDTGTLSITKTDFSGSLVGSFCAPKGMWWVGGKCFADSSQVVNKKGVGGNIRILTKDLAFFIDWGIGKSSWDTFTDHIQIGTNLNELVKNVKKSAKQVGKSVGMLVADTITVPTGLDFAIIRAAWQTGTSDMILIAPDGTVINSAYATAHPDTVMYTKLDNEAWYALVNPAAGAWQADLANLDTLGTVTVSVNTLNTPPTVAITSPTAKVSSSTTVDISYTAIDPDSTPTISLYYDTDSSGGAGAKIVEGLPMPSGTGTYSWDVSAVPAGVYYLFAIVDDGVNTPVIKYAAGTVEVVTVGAPAAPANLTAQANGTAMDLTWSLVSGATGYRVYYTDVPGEETYPKNIVVPAASSSYSLANLKPSTTYRATVTAFDAAGAESRAATPVTITTAAIPVPIVTVSKDTLDFESVPLGQSKTISLTIGNAGNADMTLSKADLLGALSSSCAVSGVTLPVTITSGSSVTVDITFTPLSGGTLNSTLKLSSNDPGTPEKSVALVASVPFLSYTVAPLAGTGGSMNPAIAQTVTVNSTTSFTITPSTGYAILTVSGCGGTLAGTTFTTGVISSACDVTATFSALPDASTTLAGPVLSSKTNFTISIADSSVSFADADGVQNTTIRLASDAAFSNMLSTQAGLAGGTFTGLTGNTTYYVNISGQAKNNATGLWENKVSPTLIVVTLPSVTAPTAFTFVDQANVSLNSVITSAAITVAGTNAPSEISVTGGTYSVNGGGFTAVAGIVNVGDSVRVQHTSAVGNSTPVNTVLTIGGVSDAFTTMTAALATTYTATPTAGTGSSITPATAQTVNSGATTSFTVAPFSGYAILSVSGCNGTLSGTTYTTGAIIANCAVAVTAVKKNANGGTAAEPTIADALKALQTYSGDIQLTPEETIRYDVAPLTANGVPQGNGVVDVADVIMILRRSIGIGSW